MDRIISDFLSFARPVELTLSKINLSEIISSCVSSIAGVSGSVGRFFLILTSLFSYQAMKYF